MEDNMEAVYLFFCELLDKGKETFPNLTEF